MNLRRITLIIAIAASSQLAIGAERFPDRPIRWVITFAPGGGTDGVARIIGPKLTELWGQPIVVDNRGGAQGSLGTAIGLKAPADGYTITMVASGMPINPHVQKSPGYGMRDLAGVARLAEAPLILTAHPSLPVRSLKELTAFAKQNPRKLSYGSAVALTQLTGELLNMTAGTDLLHVPYKGAGAAVIDLLGGQVNLLFSTPTSIMPHVKSGKLRAISVLGRKRIDALPDVPTAAEGGYPEISNVIEWYGVIVPAATPRHIVATLNAGFVRALNTPDVSQRIQSIGLTPSASTPEQFDKQIQDDYVRWGKVVKTSGVQVTE